MVAAVGKAFTVTVSLTPVKAKSQVPSFTLVKFKVVLATTEETVTSTVPPAKIVVVPEAAPV